MFPSTPIKGAFFLILEFGIVKCRVQLSQYRSLFTYHIHNNANCQRRDTATCMPAATVNNIQYNMMIVVESGGDYIHCYTKTDE